MRAGFRSLLTTESNLDVVGGAGGNEEAVGVVRRLRPDVTLMDIRVPAALDGIAATRRLVEVRRASASGSLLKQAPAEELTAAIRAAARWESLLAPGVPRRSLTRSPAARPAMMLPLATVGVALTFRARALLAPLGASLRQELGLTAVQQSLAVAVPVIVGSLPGAYRGSADGPARRAISCASPTRWLATSSGCAPGCTHAIAPVTPEADRSENPGCFYDGSPVSATVGLVRVTRRDAAAKLQKIV